MTRQRLTDQDDLVREFKEEYQLLARKIGNFWSAQTLIQQHTSFYALELLFLGGIFAHLRRLNELYLRLEADLSRDSQVCESYALVRDLIAPSLSTRRTSSLSAQGTFTQQTRANFSAAFEE